MVLFNFIWNEKREKISHYMHELDLNQRIVHFTLTFDPRNGGRGIQADFMKKIVQQPTIFFL